MKKTFFLSLIAYMLERRIKRNTISLKKGVKEKQEKHRDKQEEKPALQKRWLQQEFIFHVSMLFNFIILMPSRQGRFDQRNWC
jgi:hypothetical protein